MRPIRKNAAQRMTEELMKKIDSPRNSIRSRSKIQGVSCRLELTELRQLIFDAYGKPCRYCTRIIVAQNLVINLRVPMAKGGSSDLDNLQPICQRCNGMKGSLDEPNFILP